MTAELTAAAVRRRLERLRELYVPERDVDARRRLVADGRRAMTFAEAAAMRLAELRDLCLLSDYLHRRGG
jgi:hypothetical protein